MGHFSNRQTHHKLLRNALVTSRHTVAIKVVVYACKEHFGNKYIESNKEYHDLNVDHS